MNAVALGTIAGIFETEREGQTIIVTPLADLRELEFEQIEAGAADILHFLANGIIKNVVLDFHKTDYFGSTALGFFIKLWKRVRAKAGQMAFCNLSEHEKEILAVTHLDEIWPICNSRGAAFRVVESCAGAPR